MSHHNYRTVAILMVLGVAVLASGCTVFDTGGDSANGSSAVGDVRLSASGPLADEPPYKPVDQVHFSLDGSVVEDDTFTHVAFCLYDRDGNVLATEDLGTFTTPSAVANVTVETEQVPYYVYVHHPRFASIEGFDTEVFEYLPERHNYVTNHSDDLPFDVRQMTETGCQPPG